MEKFELKQSLKEPRIVIDFKSGKIKITGRSTLNTPEQLYPRLIDIFQVYCNKPQAITHVLVDLEQYNVQSAKYIQEIITLLADLQKQQKSKVKIYWHYDPDDYGIIGDINYLSQQLNFKIKTIAYETI